MESMSEWEHGAVENKERGAFYQDAAQYWSQVPATVDGMLGGYGFISKVDIDGSKLFLKQLFRFKVPPGKARTLDCGAGIGRITKNLLLHHFEKVDLVEQNPAFVAQARATLESHKNMGNFYCSGLQDFVPEAGAYDVIWCQWVLGHLKDDDLIAFLHGCIHGLKENGVIVIKENTTTSGKLDEDPTDSSVTRPLDRLVGLLTQAGLRCVKQKRQENFPHGLYPVYMIATRPQSGTLTDKTGQDKLDICSSTTMSDVVKSEEGKREMVTTMEESNLGEEVFEEEEANFNCQVEYSSDDSTRTEVSPSNSTYSLASQTTSRHIKNENSNDNQNATNDLKCDIV